MTFTQHDLRDQVKATVAAYVDAYDVDGIVDEIQRRHGTVDIDTVPAEEYWEIVRAHDITRSL